MVTERESSAFAMHKLRKFTGWYTHGLPNGRRLRQEINQLPDVGSFLAAVESFLEELVNDEQAA
jgi:tRNA-dihydrouridine synthase